MKTIIIILLTLSVTSAQPLFGFEKLLSAGPVSNFIPGIAKFGPNTDSTSRAKITTIKQSGINKDSINSSNENSASDISAKNDVQTTLTAQSHKQSPLDPKSSHQLESYQKEPSPNPHFPDPPKFLPQPESSQIEPPPLSESYGIESLPQPELIPQLKSYQKEPSPKPDFPDPPESLPQLVSIQIEPPPQQESLVPQPELLPQAELPLQQESLHQSDPTPELESYQTEPTPKSESSLQPKPSPQPELNLTGLLSQLLPYQLQSPYYKGPSNDRKVSTIINTASQLAENKGSFNARNQNLLKSVISNNHVASELVAQSHK